MPERLTDLSAIKAEPIDFEYRDIFRTETWSRHFQLAAPTYIENWPRALCALSIAQSGIRLSQEDAVALGSNIIERGESFAPTPLSIDGIKDKLRSRITAFPKGVFVRLGSRSPKDAFYADISKPALTGDDCLQWLTGGSERITDDLHLALANNYEPHIFLRQWIDLQPWQEFRCFMKNRKLVGISQYYYREGPFPEVAEVKDSIQWAIEERFFPDFCRASHVDSLVFDVFVKVRRNGNEVETQVKLLEINPFCEMTDPCLFDWRDPSMFDGGMLLREEQAQCQND